MIQAVLFDMDGVLVDSEALITESAILALKEYGINAKEEDFKEFTGMGEVKFIGGVANKYGHEFVDDMKTRAYDIYEGLATKQDRIKVYDRIPELIKYLRDKGYKVAVCSSADLRKIKINLNAAKVDFSWFDAVLSAEDVVNKKPDPEIYIKGAKAVGVDTKNCVVIEDAISGIKSAIGAGAVPYGVTTSFDKQTLLDVGAKVVLDNVSELMNIL